MYSFNNLWKDNQLRFSSRSSLYLAPIFWINQNWLTTCPSLLCLNDLVEVSYPGRSVRILLQTSFARIPARINTQKERKKRYIVGKSKEQKKKGESRTKERKTERERKGTRVTCGKLITVLLEKNSRVTAEEREKKRNEKGVEMLRWGGGERGGRRDGSWKWESGSGGYVNKGDINKGGRASFRRTAILPAKGATSGIHKEAAWRLSVLNSRRWRTDGRTEKRLRARLDSGISLRNACCAITHRYASRH